MADKNTWRTVCLDAGDESGDVIIELPAELLDKLGWSVGDQLVVEKPDDLLLLKLKPRTSRTVQTDPRGSRPRCLHTDKGLSAKNKPMSTIAA